MTRQEIEKYPEYIKENDLAIVKLVPKKPMSCEEFSKYQPLGRFAVRDMYRTVAVGLI